MYVEINLSYSALHISYEHLIFLIHELPSVCAWQRIFLIFFSELETLLLNLLTLSVLFTTLKRFTCPVWTFATFSEPVSKNGSFLCEVERELVITVN